MGEHRSGRWRQAAALALGIACAATQAAAQQSIIGRASVIDGDTLEVRGQRIRLHGIDAPETTQTCTRGGREWRCGQAAALALSDWLGTEAVNCQPVDRDRFGRVVARCGRAGQDVAGWLVSKGWAMDWPRYSGGAYDATQTEAQRLRRGIWSSAFQPPWEWRAERGR